MATLTEIMTQEKKRVQEEDLRVINLYLEGSFLRAYEWSAWLCVRYISKFNVTKKTIKVIDGSIVFIGFPVTSLSKFVPEGCEYKQVDEKHFIINLPESVFPASDNLLNQLSVDFEHWKQSVPMKETKEKKQEESGIPCFPSGEQPRLTSMMQQILSFPLEKKSPLDCMLFLADLKEQLAKII